MKILIVNTFEIEGGAARAANRLHQSLLEYGLNSTLLVQTKTTTNPTVIPLFTKQEAFNMRKSAHKELSDYPNKSKTLFSVSNIDSTKLVNKINSLNPDIVHFHWVAMGMIRIEDIIKIKSHIIWNCHDMMALTGGCHYDEWCGRYKHHCGKCKVLHSNTENDLSREIFDRKYFAYKNTQSLHFVGTSKWMVECLKQSVLTKNNPISHIPSGADGRIFKPLNKAECREMFKIPMNKKVILFGAMNPLGDPRKGAKELLEALKLLKIENTIFVIAGCHEQINKYELELPIYYIPEVSDEVSLSLIYNTADIIIVPSLQENLANTVVESLLCGIPVVAFDVDGNKDMITHKKNGYLVEPFKKEDLILGIEWILHNKLYDDLSLNARTSALAKFDLRILAKQYYNLYKEVVKKKYMPQALQPYSTLVQPSCNYLEYYNSPSFYEVLFNIKKDNFKCVIYGAGTVSQTVYAVIPNNIIAYVDLSNNEKYSSSSEEKIFHPSSLKDISYDKIIISVLGREKTIVQYLVEELNVPYHKIIIFDL